MSTSPRLRRLAASLLIVSASLMPQLFMFDARAQTAPARDAALPYFTEPAVAPDKSEIAFASGGDLWSVPVRGGEARLLVSHAATESRPVYSPDNSRLAFLSTRTGAGDVYILTFDTGDVRRLTFDDAPETLDAWSADGRWIYFSSASRDIAGMNDIYRVSPEGGTPMIVSADRYTNEFAAAPAPDNRSLAFSARGIAGAQWWRKGHSHIDESEIWTMSLDDAGAAKYTQLVERAGKNLWAMWSRDASRIYFVSDRGGAENIWMRRVDRPSAAPEQVTRFTDGRVLFPSISADGELIVFERDFKLHTLDTGSGRTAELRITRRGAPSAPGVERLRLTEGMQELAVAPDGKKLAFTVRGEIFAASSTDGGDAVRITNSIGEDAQAAWSPDSRRLAYISDRDGAPHIYLYDFSTNAETRLTTIARADASPRFSPDGKQLAFIRDARELRTINLDTRQERLLVTATFERPPVDAERPFVWSPDSRFIAYLPVGEKLFANPHVVAVDETVADKGGRPVAFLANVGANTVSWSPDGAYLLFNTGQRTETGQLARVDLIPRTPRFREDQFRDLFREESPRSPAPDRPRTAPTPAAPTTTQTTPAPQQPATPNSPAMPSTTPNTTPAPETPQSPVAPSSAATPLTDDDAGEAKPDPKRVRVVYDEIRRRLSLLPVGLDVNYQAVSPDGKSVVMIASAAGQENLYIYSLDELARETPVARQITSTAGAKSAAQFSPDGKEIFYLDANRINVATVDGSRPPRPLAVAAEMDADFAAEKLSLFDQAWTLLRDHFYDPNYHGADWTRVRARFEPHIRGARTPDEARRVMSLMIGELNASHLGIAAPPAPAAAPSTGRTGLRFDRAEYERSGRLRVAEVIPLSPAALVDVRAGSYLLKVDGKTIDARTNLDELLAYKINRRTVLTIGSSADERGGREVVIRPVNAATEKALLYRDWIERNRAYVLRASNNRLGYVHMFDMSAASLAQLYVDLDAENHNREAVVIDVRNNNGGFVNVYAIDVFARRGYLTMTPRGNPGASARTVLGQRSLERPTVLVTNQHSLSDAEDFAEGYRALRLGSIVGEPTAGWIIFTWNVRLTDGSTLRLPRAKITANDGTNMELNPRPVDVRVTREIGETLQGRDSQLDRAVSELLNGVGKKAGERTAQK